MDCGFWGAAEAKKKTLEFTTDDEVDGDDYDEWDCFIVIREGVQKKRFSLGDFSQMWVGGVADSQTRSQMCLPTHPRQGFCEIWKNEK